LGLAIARGFVQANGGKLYVESLPGQGATFVFELPLDPVVPSEEAREPVGVAGATGESGAAGIDGGAVGADGLPGEPRAAGERDG
jgi:hypothetical protein